MTMLQAILLERFAWVCDELRAGRTFPDEVLALMAKQARDQIPEPWKSNGTLQ